MRISAVIWAKDEVQLIEKTVRNFLRIGAHSVSIMDDGSTDGTAELVARLAADLPQVFQILLDGPLDLTAALRIDGPVFGPILARDNPDWLLFGDPDEFWIPHGQSLCDLADLADHDLLVIPRYNYAKDHTDFDPACLESPPALAALPLVVQRQILTPKIAREQPDKKWIMHQISPRIMVRPDLITGFVIGLHDAVPKEGLTLRQTQISDMVVAHIPFSNLARFQRKVVNIAGVFARFDKEHVKDMAWHWRQLLRDVENTSVEAEFRRQCFSREELATMSDQGILASAADLFEAQGLGPITWAAAPAPFWTRLWRYMTRKTNV